MTLFTRIASAALAACLLALAAPAAHAQQESTACLTAGAAGTYRVTLTQSGREMAPALVVLDRMQGCLAGIIVIDGNASPLDRLAVVDGTLTGTMRTSSGHAKVTLRFEENRVAGTLTTKGQRWDLAGERSS